MKQKIKILMSLLLLSIGTAGLAQNIGGNTSPLKYSVHLYSIKMGDVTYTPNWGLYQAGTTAGEIEDGTAVSKKMVEGVDYDVLLVSASEKTDPSTHAYWKIQFKSITPGTYVIGYRESTGGANDCLTAAVQEIHVYPPFDVDVALSDPLDAANCGDESGNTKVTSADIQAQTTTVKYRVYMEYPNDPAYVTTGGVGYWRFSFTVNAVGVVAGSNSKIAGIQVTIGATTTAPFSDAIGLSTYTGSMNVTPMSATEVTIAVAYSDVLGVTQNVAFELSSIFGAYLEADVDIVENTPGGGGNKLSHTIYAMPNVSEITALN